MLKWTQTQNKNKLNTDETRIEHDSTNLELDDATSHNLYLHYIRLLWIHVLSNFILPFVCISRHYLSSKHLLIYNSKFLKGKHTSNISLVVSINQQSKNPPLCPQLNFTKMCKFRFIVTMLSLSLFSCHHLLFHVCWLKCCFIVSVHCASPLFSYPGSMMLNQAVYQLLRILNTLWCKDQQTTHWNI